MSVIFLSLIATLSLVIAMVMLIYATAFAFSSDSEKIANFNSTRLHFLAFLTFGWLLANIATTLMIIGYHLWHIVDALAK